MEVAGRLGLGLVLGILGIQDARTKKVSLPILCAGVAMQLGAFLLGKTGGADLRMALGGVTLGAFLLAVSAVSKGQIGLGDGLVFCMTGLALGFWENLGLMSLSFLLAGAYGVAGLLRKKFDRKKSLPFLPFVFLAYLGTVFL